jgi:hypothetical protein
MSGDYNVTLSMVNDTCNAAANPLLARPSTVPHPAGATTQTTAVLPVGSAGYTQIAAWIARAAATHDEADALPAGRPVPGRRPAGQPGRLWRWWRAGQPADTVANPPGASGQKLSFLYFQRCVNPVLNTPLPVRIGGNTTTNTCAAGGCHDNVSGTGGALRLLGSAAPVDASALPDARARQRHVQELLLIARGKRGRQSRPEPPAEQAAGAQHTARGRPGLRDGGRPIAAQLIRYWINHPMPAGRTNSAPRPTPCSPLPTRLWAPATSIDPTPDAEPPHTAACTRPAPVARSPAGMGADAALAVQAGAHGRHGADATRLPPRPKKPVSACRSPTPFWNCTPARVAATRCSTWSNANAG